MAGGNDGKIEGRAEHVAGAVQSWGGHQIRCSWEQDCKSTVVVQVGLTCFCRQGDGMLPPASLNKFRENVCSKRGSN